MPFCPDCGEELDDFSPCGCAFDRIKKPKAKDGTQYATSMREMVARKLDRQRTAKPAGRMNR